MPQKSDNLTLVDNITPVLLGRCASYPSGLRTLHDSPPRLPHPFAFGLNDFFAGRADRAIALPDGDAPRASIRGQEAGGCCNDLPKWHEDSKQARPSRP